MPEAIVVAIISLAGIVITNVVSVKKSKDDRNEFAKQLYAELDKRSELSDAGLRKEIAVLMEQMDSLRQEVKKFNAVLEKVYQLEKDVAVNKEQIASIRTHMNDLERVVNK